LPARTRILKLLAVWKRTILRRPLANSLAASQTVTLVGLHVIQNAGSKVQVVPVPGVTGRGA